MIRFPSINPSTKPFIIIFFLGFIAWLPFINRPVSVDDHAIYQQALSLRHHLSKPYQEADRGMGWTKGESPEDNNPPLYIYTQALFMKAFGEAEWKLHLLQMLYNFVGVFSFFLIARRFTDFPLWATSLWIFTPHFLLTANSLLVDSLLPALFLLGIYLWIRGWEEDRPLLLLTAAFVLGLVPLVKYTGVLAWAVAIGWGLIVRRKRRIKNWLFLSLSIFMLFGWIILSKHLYGRSHMNAVMSGSVIKPSFFQLLTLFEFSSGTTFFMSLVSLILIMKRASTILISLIVYVVMCLLLVAYGLPIMVSSQFAGWATLFLVWITFSVGEKTNSNLNPFLNIWIVVGILGLLMARGWVCARYLVIIGPAFILMSVRMLGTYSSNLLNSRKFRRVSFSLLALCSLLLQQSDYQRAVNDKDMAGRLNRWVTDHPGSGRAYYPEEMLSGLGFYLDKSHLWVPINHKDSLSTGDRSIVLYRTIPPRFLPRMNSPRTVENIEIKTWNPLRTFDFRSSAGFYGSIWSPLPFSFSRAPLESVFILEEMGASPN